MPRIFIRGFWIGLGLVVFGLCVVLSSRALVSIPFPTGRWHYETVLSGDKDVLWGRAVPGSYPKKYLIEISTANFDEVHISFPYLNYFSMRKEVASEALQVFVRKKLPEASYVALLYSGENSITLPFEKKAEGIYATPAFLVFYNKTNITSYQGYKVLIIDPVSGRLDGKIQKIVVDKP